MLRYLLIIALTILSSSPHAFADQPTFSVNGWSIVLVPSFESQTGTGKNNLSVTGLNHSLLFGQLLNSQMSGAQGRLSQVLALAYDDKDIMAPLESIEPFALLNNQAVSVQILTPGDASVWNSPANFAQSLLTNQRPGISVMAMPADMIQAFVSALSSADLPPVGMHQYVVLSGLQAPFTVSVYDDGLKSQDTYPLFKLPKTSQCPQTHVSFHVPKPANLRPYLNQTAFLVRHVEAHPTGSFENGNYVCQGQWRALGANDRLKTVMDDRKPDYVFTTNPNGIIDCNGSCSYVRPSLTVAPYAVQNDLPLTLAEFPWNAPIDLARALFDQASPYFQHPERNSRILVGWEHGNLEKAVKYLVGTVYNDPAKAALIPSWAFNDYDSVWILSTDKDGGLTFSNTCEGIPSTALPSTCPAFFPEQ